MTGIPPRRFVAPSIAAGAIDWITTEQMIEVDRVMIEDLHIELIQMMENAGRNLARLALDMFQPKAVLVMSGSGGNGGGGLVAARHLANAGVDVSVVTTRQSADTAPVPRHQLDIVTRMGLRIVSIDEGDTASVVNQPVDLVIDALIGYSLRGQVGGRTARLIDTIARSGSLILALDNPSGLDASTGSSTASVVADATMTLALPKLGLRDNPAVGRLFVADISVPQSVYRTIGLERFPDFSAGPIVAVEQGDHRS